MGKAWNLVCIKMKPEVGAFDVRTQHKLQGEGLGWSSSLYYALSLFNTVTRCNMINYTIYLMILS